MRLVSFVGSLSLVVACGVGCGQPDAPAPATQPPIPDAAPPADEEEGGEPNADPAGEAEANGAAADPFEANLQKMLAAGQGACLTLEGPGEEIVQCVDEGNEAPLIVQLGHYPSAEAPGEALAAAGVAVPGTWKLAEWEAEAFVSYTVPRGQSKQLARFLRETFEKFYGVEPAMAVRFSLEPL